VIRKNRGGGEKRASVVCLVEEGKETTDVQVLPVVTMVDVEYNRIVVAWDTMRAGPQSGMSPWE
jgi:hypothetical protein